MLSNRSLILFTVAFLIWLASIANAQCTNKPFAPCKLYETADAVFIGTVKEIGYSEPFDDGIGMSKKILRHKTALLTIKESFKGIAEKQTEITVTTTQIQKRSQSGELAFEKYIYVEFMGETAFDCPFDEFSQDETYLVYAKRKTSERKSSFFADYAATVGDATDAITYLRNRVAGNPGAMLYGRVTRKMRPLDYDFGDMPKRPFRNIKVEIQSETQHFITTTDENGNYLFSDIPPGEYSIKCDLPERLDTENNAKKLTLSAQSCMEYDIEVLTTGQISGTVLDHEGKPKLLEVELVVAAEAKNAKPHKFVVYSDWQSGKFEFKNIPPAQYFLGFHLSKLCNQYTAHGGEGSVSCRPRTYYPGVTDITQATLINLAEGEQLKDFDFRLPPPFSRRTISGVTVMPDSKPASNAEVTLMISQGESVEFGGFTKTDEYGRFSVSAYDELTSWVSAVVNIKGKYLHSEPTELSNNGDIYGIKLVVSSSGKFCSLCYNKYWKRKGTPPQ
jgi:hypothetical protein